MPAGNQHDPLDVALGKGPPAHVAANPKLTRPQANFFGSVAGTRSPINRQSSRIGNPFATSPVLGGSGFTEVSPALQTQLAASTLGQTPRQRLARTIAGDAKPAPGRKPLPLTPTTQKIVDTAPKTGGRAARARARATEAAITVPTRTLKIPVRTHATVGPYSGLGSSTSIQVAATAPELLAAAGKLHAAGIPIAALSSDLQNKITGAIAHFALSPSYKYPVPDLQRYDAKTKAMFGLPPSATDGDVIRAQVADYLPKRDWFSTAASNVPRNAIQMTAAPFAIANAAGAVLHNGVFGGLNRDPTHGFGLFQGDWNPAKQLGTEFVRQQVQYGKDLWNDPSRTIAHDPITFGTSVLGVGRLAGASAGMAARLGAVEKLGAREGKLGAAAGAVNRFATPRERNVIPAGYADPTFVGPVPHIPLGPTSKHLDVRVAQAAHDWLASHVPVMGSRLEKTRAMATKREESRLRDQAYREHVEPAVRAISQLKRPIRRAVLFARGQGVTEAELAHYFETMAEKHRALEPVDPMLAHQAAHDAGTPLVDAHGEPLPPPDPRLHQNEHAHWQIIQHDLEKNAKDWRGIATQTGDVMTQGMQDALTASIHASRAAEGFIRGQRRLNGKPLLQESTLTRRAYLPMARIKAAAGDKNAQEFLHLDEEIQQLEAKAKSADPAHHEAILRRLDEVRNEQWDKREALHATVTKRIAEQQRVVDTMQTHAARTPVTDTVEKILNRQGHVPRPEARRLGEMQGRAAEAFPVGDRIQPHELETANKHLRLLERKMRAAQNPATRRRLQAKIDEFTPIRDKMAEAPVGVEARQLRAQAARAGVETRTAEALSKAAAPVLPKALRLDELQGRRMTGPVERQLAKLERQRARIEEKRTLPADYHTAATRRLEERAHAADPQRLADELAAREQEVAAAFAKLRNSHRAGTTGIDSQITELRAQLDAEASGKAPFDPTLYDRLMAAEHAKIAVGPKNYLPDAGVAPLDMHDPLYFPHTRANRSSARKRIIGGQGGGKVNLDAVPSYAGTGRLGKKGSPFSGDMLETGGVSSDPAVFFGAAAKPAAVASALSHLQSQMSGFSIRPEPGQQYDARKWVRLDIAKYGNESRASAHEYTTDQIDRQVAEHTPADDKKQLEELFSHFHDELPGLGGRENRAKASIVYRHVPTDASKDYVLVSRHAYEALQNDFLHGGIYSSIPFARLQKATQMWRWATLLARPAWLASNFTGNTIQAMTGGAGLTSFARAYGKRYDSVIPERAKNTGLYRNDVARPAGAGVTASALGKFGDMVANANVRFENYTRKALYLRHAIPEAKRRAAIAENRKIGSGFVNMNKELQPHLAKLGVEEQAAPRIVKIVNRWLGDFSRAKNTPLLDLVSPFHRWFTFITKLVATMPVKTPGRALLLQRVGEFGYQEQNQQFGDFIPNSMLGSIPLGSIFKSTQAINPYATVFQLLNPADESSTHPGGIGYGGLAQALNPGVTAAVEFATGKSIHNNFADLKDSAGNPVGPFNWRVGVHGVENTVPLASAAQGYDSAATSWNPFDPQTAHKGTGAQASIPGWMRAVGYFGGSIRHYDTQKNADTSIMRLRSQAILEAKNAAKAQQKAKYGG